RMFGGARNGYCSTDNPLRVTTPSRTIRIEMTIATIGLRMKKFDMARFPFRLLLGFRYWRRGSWVHLGARSYFLHAFHDDPIAGVQPLKNNDVLVRLVTNSDRSQRGFVLRVDNQNGLGALELLNRPLRDEDRILAFGNRRAHARELTRPQ